MPDAAHEGASPATTLGPAPDASDGAPVVAAPASAAQVATGPDARPLWRHLLKLARPTQWTKGAFVLVGPFYAVAAGTQEVAWTGAAGAFLAFGFGSSACYVLNDILDREADRAHPRKCRRPIASGAVSLRTASGWGLALFVAALGSIFLAPVQARWWLALTVFIYMLNVAAYSAHLKHRPIIDVISLASGFVLRVLGGCAAAVVHPSSWLLNCIFFLSMFLAFGKRLGERRTLGDAASSARGVQAIYTDDLLRMSVVVTAVATLVTYAGYVQYNEDQYTRGFNLLWLTMLPATYGLLRCIVLLERGEYDDPTELAGHDRPFQAAVMVFTLITMAVIAAVHHGPAAT